MVSRTALFFVVATAVVASALADNACTNDADAAVIKNVGPDALQSRVSSCAVGCFGGADCTTKCVAKSLHTSQGCSACFGADTKCMKSGCFFQCVNPSSEGCLKCHDKKCAPAFNTCSGLAPTLPQFVRDIIDDDAVAADAGQCTDDADMAALNVHAADLHDKVQKCATGCLGGADCTTKCVVAALGTSASCSGCFGADAACMKSNCMLRCLNPSSAGCLKCHADKCAASYTACSGIPALIPVETINQILAAVAADAAPQEAGKACVNDQDTKAFIDHAKDFRDIVTNCGKGCLARETCSAQCVEKKIGTTHACAGCFGKDAACLRKKCIWKCANPFGGDCEKCYREKCQPGFVACAGVTP